MLRSDNGYFRQDLIEALIFAGAATEADLSEATNYMVADIAAELDALQLDGITRAGWGAWSYCGGPISEAFAKS